MYICGFFHDLGKASSYFQEYLKDPQKPTTSLKNHSLPSAVFVFYVVRQYLQDKKIDKKIKDERIFLLSALCFIVVKRHHGNLGDFKNELCLNSKENLKKQFDSINANAVQEIIAIANKKLQLSVQWNNFISWFDDNGFSEEIESKLIRFYPLNFKKWDSSQKSEVYYLFLWMFGVLLYSDKSDVILARHVPKIQKVTLKYLEDYRVCNKFNKAKTNIDQLKNKAYFSVLQSLEEKFNPKQHFYSISLPTGFGKTLTSIGAALKLKEVAGLCTGKIIIAVPFTSIIDQNYEVYREVFKNPDSSLLLKHHHLTEPKYKENEDSILDTDQSQYLIETWQSSVVVTTFVQLIETLITNNKSKLLKISALSNAVIILDEVQQIPHQLWELIRQSFFSIAEHLNCYIILMSATQPLIFRPEEEITELVANYRSYFSFFNRTRLINKTKEAIMLEDFIADIINYAYEHPKKDILIILNTKQSTLKTYRAICEKDDKEDTEIYYLTTLITPYERKQKIKNIKTKSDKRKIIVSTQLVEAGVDISLHTVFRTLAPLDSIIQAAGRANRYNEKGEISEVFIYKIEDLYRATNIIYGGDLIKKTENVLKSYDIITEKDYLKLIECYFEQVKDLSVYSDHTVLNSLLDLNFKEIGKFQLIEDTNSESLFIGLNTEARSVWDKFVQLKNKDLNPFEKKKEFAEFKSTFYDYVISVTVKYDEKDIGLPFEPTYGFYYIDIENQKTPIYNCNADFLPNKEGYIFKGINTLVY